MRGDKGGGYQNDYLRKSFALIRAYERPSTEGKRIGPKGPSLKDALHLADLLTTGGAGQIVSDKLHGKQPDLMTVGALAGGGRLGPRKVGGIYKNSRTGEVYKVLHIEGNNLKTQRVPNPFTKEKFGFEHTPRWHSEAWHPKDRVYLDPDRNTPDVMAPKEFPWLSTDNPGDRWPHGRQEWFHKSRSVPPTDTYMSHLLHSRLGVKPVRDTQQLSAVSGHVGLRPDYLNRDHRGGSYALPHRENKQLFLKDLMSLPMMKKILFNYHYKGRN